jgi:hypothetical protein
MNTSNELIAVIESARTNGNFVKSVRKQKYAPEKFYMTLASGKQLGPIACAGDEESLNRKYDEAVAYLESLKSTKPRIAA